MSAPSNSCRPLTDAQYTRFLLGELLPCCGVDDCAYRKWGVPLQIVHFTWVRYLFCNTHKYQSSTIMDVGGACEE